VCVSKYALRTCKQASISIMLHIKQETTSTGTSLCVGGGVAQLYVCVSRVGGACVRVGGSRREGLRAKTLHSNRRQPYIPIRAEFRVWESPKWGRWLGGWLNMSRAGSITHPPTDPTHTHTVQQGVTRVRPVHSAQHPLPPRPSLGLTLLATLLDNPFGAVFRSVGVWTCKQAPE